MLKIYAFRPEDENLILSTGFAVLRPIQNVADTRFFYHCLRNEEFQSEKNRSYTGATQKAITNEKVESLTIPLPPLADQQRIAEALDRANVLRAKRRAALTHLNELTEILFLELFGDPATNPFPPIALQQEFAHRVEAALAKLYALFATLQHRACK